MTTFDPVEWLELTEYIMLQSLLNETEEVVINVARPVIPPSPSLYSFYGCFGYTCRLRVKWLFEYSGAALYFLHWFTVQTCRIFKLTGRWISKFRKKTFVQTNMKKEEKEEHRSALRTQSERWVPKRFVITKHAHIKNAFTHGKSWLVRDSHEENDGDDRKGSEKLFKPFPRSDNPVWSMQQKSFRHYSKSINVLVCAHVD